MSLRPEAGDTPERKEPSDVQGGWMPPPTGFPFFSGMERAFLQTKFLASGSSLGHVPMKKFSNQTYRRDPKIRQREGTAPPPPPLSKELTHFSDHEDDI